MEQLRSIWEQIQDFMDQLSTSQKWSLGLVVVAVVVAIGTLLRIQMKTNMRPLGLNLTPAEQSRVIDHLDENQVPYELRQGALYVPRNTADKLVFDLAGKGLIQSDQRLTEWLFQQSFDTRHKREMKMNVTRERRLALMIAKTDPVLSADVRITPGEDSQVLSEGKPAKASVRVKLIGSNRLKQEEVRAIARVVAGSVENLSPSGVTIIDNNMNYYRVSDEEGPAYMSARLKEQKAQLEKDYQSKVGKLFRWTPKESVAVNVHLSNEKISKTSTTQEGEPKFEQRTKTTKEGMQAGTPGTKENTEPDVGVGETVGQNGASAGGPTPSRPFRSTREQETKTEEFVESHVKKQTEIMPGDVELVRATVVLPREDLYRQVLGRAPRQGDREDNEIQQKIQSQLKTYKQTVQNLLEIPGESDKQNTQVDVMTASFKPPAPPEKPPVQDRLLNFVKDNLNTLLLSLVILIGLFVIYRIVRSSFTTDVEQEIDRLRTRLEQEEESIEGVPTEARRETIEEMRRRVEEAVEDNPSAAAGLIRRWLGEEGSNA